jgi:hypothetical protein
MLLQWFIVRQLILGRNNNVTNDLMILMRWRLLRLERKEMAGDQQEDLALIALMTLKE